MRTIFPILLFVVLLSNDVAIAQSPLQAPRIGVLMPGSAQDLDEQRHLQAFVQGFKEFGYVAGQNILFKYRGAEREVNLLPRLAAELVALKVSVIVAVGTTAIDAAFKATKNIPIVMISGGHPVGRGYVKTLTVPGGNVTGLSSFAYGGGGKRIELLKEAFPRVSRVIVLNADRRKSRVEDYLREGKGLGLGFESLDVYSAEELKQAFVRLTTGSLDALITVRNAFTIRHAEQITDFALRNRLPSIYESREFVEKGGLISYGVNYTASWRRSAFFVDKILKGASPAVLPIEPPQFEFLVNLRTANKMGHRIPPEILLEATEVIQ
jgi:putative ABC transport system substrate-binding protein